MSDSEHEEPRRKIGKVNKHLHTKEMMKIARSKGEEFVTDKGKLVEAKTTGTDCTCRNRCMANFSADEKSAIISNLYDGRPKNERDVYLQGLIVRSDVERHRPKKPDSKQAVSSFKYFAMKGNERIMVCRQAYGSLHSISNKAITRLTQLLQAGKSPKDGRGMHGNRTNVLAPDIVLKIHNHIDSFPKHVSHYSSHPITYLDAELSVTKMYQLFIEKHFELLGTVKYEYYLRYFKDNFGFRFGRPQVDVCPTCEELNTKIKSPTLNETAKRVAVAELLVHKRRARKFYTKLKEITELSKTDPKVNGIVFDYMQNLPLPFMPVQDMFYLRKLWYYVFNIQDLKTKQSVFYNYSEGEANKGPNEVSSFVLDFITNHLPKEVEILHVFCDSTSGQNRNHTLSRLIMALSMSGRFKEIHQYFPVRGHSFMPCDRTFGTIKRAVKKFDRIYAPHQYLEIICNAKKNSPHHIVNHVQTEDILEVKNWWPQYFKKTPKSFPFGNPPQKVKFSISQYLHLTYKKEAKGVVKCSKSIDSPVNYKFKLSKSNDVPLPTTKAYNGKVPIKKKKIDDVRKIMQYIPDEQKAFFEERLAWPTINVAEENDGYEDD